MGYLERLERLVRLCNILTDELNALAVDHAEAYGLARQLLAECPEMAFTLGQILNRMHPVPDSLSA